MRKILIAILACCTLNAFAEKNFIDQNYVEITTDAELKVAPNEIVLHIVLDESHYQKETLKSLEKRMISVLKTAGVDVEKQLKVVDMSTDLQIKFLSKKIKAAQEYMLTLDSADILLRVFKALGGAQIGDVNVAKVSHTDIDSLRSETRKLVIRKARQHADDLAEAIDQKVGRALYISSGNYGYVNYSMPRYKSNVSAMSVEADEVSPALEFEPITITSNVTVRFELK